MSWSATKYAWKCSHKDAQGDEIVRGSVKMFMLAVAYKILPNYIESEPVSLKEFEQLTGFHDRQLRACRRVLLNLGELQQGGDRVCPRYVFPKMLGPLFVTADALPSGKDRRMNRQNLPHHPAKYAGLERRNAGGVLSLDPSTNTVLTTTTRPEEVAAVTAFLDWFIEEYPKHRHGVLYSVDPAVAEAVVSELLAGRSVDRLQAMAREMWAERSDRWILQSDYSLHVLKHRATYLENVVVSQTRWAIVKEAAEWKCPMCDTQNPAALRVCGCGEGRPVQREVSA